MPFVKLLNVQFVWTIYLYKLFYIPNELHENI